MSALTNAFTMFATACVSGFIIIYHFIIIVSCFIIYLLLITLSLFVMYLLLVTLSLFIMYIYYLLHHNRLDYVDCISCYYYWWLMLPSLKRGLVLMSALTNAFTMFATVCVSGFIVIYLFIHYLSLFIFLFITFSLFICLFIT